MTIAVPRRANLLAYCRAEAPRYSNPEPSTDNRFIYRFYFPTNYYIIC